MKSQTNFDLERLDRLNLEPICPTCKKIMKHYGSMSIFTKKPVIVLNCTNDFCKKYNIEAVYTQCGNLEYTLKNQI